MLVRQCDSCKEPIARSEDWRKITITEGNHETIYDLCAECAKAPMTFGHIELRYDRVPIAQILR